MSAKDDRVFDLTLQSWDTLLALPSTTLIEPVDFVPRPTPAFVLDLSNDTISHDLLASTAVLAGGIARCEWDAAHLYGWDAFFAFMSAQGEFTTQDVNGNEFRVDRYAANQPGAPYHAAVPTRSGRSLRFDFRTMPATDIIYQKGEVYFGSPIEPMNWGMWLLHAIPSAIEYLQTGQCGRFGCWSKFDWQRNLLSYVGIPPEKLLQLDEWKLYSFDKLRFRVYPAMELYVGPRDRAIFASIAERSTAISQIPVHERIYVSRLAKSASSEVRRLQNEAELAQALEKLGFAIIEPEKLSFTDQIATFNAAKVIVGPGGAGMFNTIFCRPGTKVVTIEASNAFVQNHGILFKSLGLEYGVIFGAREPTDTNWPHHKWTLQVESAVAQIKAFL